MISAGQLAAARFSCSQALKTRSAVAAIARQQFEFEQEIHLHVFMQLANRW
jgi:hypothetical protein